MSDSEQKLIEDVQKISKEAIKAGKQRDLTVREVIQTLVNDFDHQQDTLKSKPIKTIIKETAAKTLHSIEVADSNPTPVANQENAHQAAASGKLKPSKPPSKNSRKRTRASTKTDFKSAEMVDSDGNSVRGQDDTNNEPKKIRKTSNKKPKIEKEKPADHPKSKHPSDPESSNKNSCSDLDDDQSGQDEAETKTKKKKKGKAKKFQIDKEEDKIGRLKALVVACGVRKMWKQELKDCSTNQEQITHLTKMLRDLGMSGRISFQKAKKIKAQRALEAEVDELTPAAQVESEADDDDPDQQSQGLEKEIPKPRSKRIRKNRTAKDSASDHSDSHVVIKPKTKKNPFAFLGDQGSEDSS